ncbi:uncharacterized protein LOC132949843 [Metopolophium dirhodum]|uniref:uncharacterized protein LOC132949843 n=1 Tax=Metopolophium dirhodum TaxID=44670 RepID=UPI00298FD1BB|nr:uncharacterized protein LOC132949843 [Metopolophium dirhodum]
MYLINNPGLIFLILFTLAYVNCDDTPGPYNSHDDSENKRCKIPWVEASDGNGNIATCKLKCQTKCRFYQQTDQWRCRSSSTGLTKKCECCRDNIPPPSPPS